MSSRIYLGELEELILLMVALLDNEAYGVSITEQLQKQAGRDISISAVHAVLHRLEEKGFVSIGCEPCTRKLDPEMQEREARWFGMNKVECGLHTDLINK